MSINSVGSSAMRQPTVSGDQEHVVTSRDSGRENIRSRRNSIEKSIGLEMPASPAVKKPVKISKDRAPKIDFLEKNDLRSVPLNHLVRKNEFYKHATNECADLAKRDLLLGAVFEENLPDLLAPREEQRQRHEKQAANAEKSYKRTSRMLGKRQYY